MAKMKLYAVEVEVKTRRTVFVDARKVGGVEEKLYTELGWQDAVRFVDGREVLPMWAPKKDDPDFRVVSVKEVGQ